MKWFLAGLALVFASLAGGIVAIILGYRQVISHYISEAPRQPAETIPPSRTARSTRQSEFRGGAGSRKSLRSLPCYACLLRSSKAKPKIPKARSPQPTTTT